MVKMKKILLILFVLVLISACSAQEEVTPIIEQNESQEPIEDEYVELRDDFWVSYENNFFEMKGEVLLPNPCYEAILSSEFSEGLLVINIQIADTSSPELVCSQVITSTQVFLEGQYINLERLDIFKESALVYNQTFEETQESEDLEESEEQE